MLFRGPESGFSFERALQLVGVFALIGLVSTVAGVAWAIWCAVAYVAGLGG